MDIRMTRELHPPTGRVLVRCGICGDDFAIWPSMVGKRKTCGPPCKRRWMSVSQKGRQQHPNSRHAAARASQTRFYAKLQLAVDGQFTERDKRLIKEVYRAAWQRGFNRGSQRRQREGAAV